MDNLKMKNDTLAVSEMNDSGSDLKGATKEFFRVFFGRGIISRIALAIVIILILITIFAPLIAPYDPLLQDTKHPKEWVSSEHLLGTDEVGRDVLSRLIYGARISLLSSVVAGLIGGIIGSILGLIAGYSNRFVNGIIMRFTDAWLSIPGMILTLVLANILGGGVTAIIISIAVGMIPTYIRMVSGNVLSLRENDYITAAEIVGQSKWTILFEHLLPNCFPSLIVLYTANLGTGIMLESSLSYLGVGIQPPTATWGGMVSSSFKYMTTAPHLAILPGICIILAVVAFNIVGDSLRDALDPRLRGKL